MRIQHNIMAMGAYRNYTNNVNAMKRNLEKLSSGYKINRAGDDAAGLAISEKMRAQITGLETAQKNAKDGISLVQTAEGALTEVHDMLNRMVSLATQSANGTYDNETDRAQLQKEVSQLLDEINRIADSSNFNGIKLLDGSMDATPIAGALTNLKAVAGDQFANAINSVLPDAAKSQILGTDTVLHKGASGSTSAQFGVSLHNVTFSNDDANGSITIKFGDDTLTLKGGATKATMDTGDILTNLTGAADDPAATGTNIRELKIGTAGNEVVYNVEGDTLEEQLTSWVNQFNNDTTANSNGAVIAEMKGGSILFSSVEVEQGATVGNALSVGGQSLSNGVDAVAEKNTVTVTYALPADDATLTINGTTYHFKDGVTAADLADGEVGVDTNGWAASDAAKWLTEKLGEAGAFEVTGFDSVAAGGFTGTNTFDLTASEKQAATSDNGLLAADVATAINAKISDLTGGALTNAAAVVRKTQGVDGVAATYNTGNLERVDSSLTIAGYKANITSTDPEDQLEEFMKAYNNDPTNKFTASWNDDGNGIKFIAKETGDIGVAAGAVGTTDTATDTANQTFQATAVAGVDSVLGTNKTMDAKAILNAIMTGKAYLNDTTAADASKILGVTDLQNGVTLSDGATYKITAEGDTLTFTQLETDTDPVTNEIMPTVLDRKVEITGTLNQTTKKNTVSGDYQVSTTFNTPNGADSGDRLASTWFINKSENIVDGGAIFIGGKNYQFTTDEAAAKEDATKVYIGDLLNDEGKIEDADMEKVNERITVAAKDNEVYTVGYDKNRLTFTEKVGYTTGDQEYDLTKLSEIERSLGFTGPETPSDGKSLTLQIGDTAEEFNQLKVNIKDMHAESLGIADLDISTQEGAAIAVDKIKAAINTVSDVRGTLGATQNRLDHTINNLSVMTENIQDAESTIRDTDVAAEMMEYTKNNILIQSAQAMLAQANQVPQGVLQLLQ